MTTPQYVYKITEVVKITDGDTYWLRVDVGFRQTILIDCRLDGYDTPELIRFRSTLEHDKAIEAKQYAADFLNDASTSLWIKTAKDPDDFGRWLGVIWHEDADGNRRYLGAELVDKELASVWPTRWRDQYGPVSE